MSPLISKVNNKVLPDGFFKCILFSRFIYLLMQVSFNHLIPDHQSDGFQSPYKLIPVQSSFLNSIVEFTLSGYARWDGQYFLHISILGYTHENCLAFFPAYPLLLRFPSKCIVLLCFNQISDWNASLVSSFLVNTVCFLVAAKFLYLLTVKLFGSPYFAFQTLKLFIISPATVFFLAPYSESLFCALTLSGIYYCTEYKFSFAGVIFAVSGLTRSNGIVNIGFLLFFALRAALHTKWRSLPTLIVKTVISIIVAIIPFLCYQYYAFALFCHHHPTGLPNVIYSYLVEMNLAIPGEKIPEWCNHTVPFSYSQVQSQYWNVGYMRYFEWKQFPNFLLASPILALVFIYSFSYTKENLSSLKVSFTSRQPISHPVFNRQAGVFAVHSLFLGIFTIFFAHVQISTRLIGSSSPAVYWVMCWLLGEKEEKTIRLGLLERWNPIWWWYRWYKILPTNGKIVLVYCLSYTFIGTLMFVNHLPWT